MMRTSSRIDVGPTCARSVIAAVRGAGKRYAGVQALDDVDFDIAPGEVRAILGKNGAGKSTLIRLLTGAETPDAGTVTIADRALDLSGEARSRQAAALGIRAVYQELSLVAGMSVAENMFLGEWPSRAGVLDHRTMAARAGEALRQLGLRLDPWRLVETLTQAERQLVEIARAMLGSPRLVILDEPTSSLAAAEVDLVFAAVRRMTAAGVAVIYVSHRMREIREIADSATVMRDGRVISTAPLAETDTAGIVRMMLGHDEHADDGVDAAALGPVVLSVLGLSVPPKLERIDFDLFRGEVLGIAGLLGSGRTELLRAILGLDPPTGGTVAVDGVAIRHPTYHAMLARGLGFTPESRKEDGIVPLLGVDENTVATDLDAVSSMGVLSRTRIRAATERMIARMSIKTAGTATPIGTLSGGNQQKVVIGRWVHARSRILLLDEPTRGVDVEAKAQIYAIIRGLAREGRSIIFVSSEVEELPKVCDRVIVLRDGTITDTFQQPAIDADRLMMASIAGMAD